MAGLTAEQQAIVAVRGRDVLVTAGAGSGKTRVLVDRYLALLEECAVSEIAAVTFTDAAAAEMRQRVRHEVMSRPDLASHRAALDEAVIGTIHSLCRGLLRQYAFEAGIDPSAPVLAEDEAEFERIAACLDALEAAASGDGPALAAVRAIGTYGLSDALPTMVARRDEVRAAFAALPGATTAEWEAHIRAVLDEALAAAVTAAVPGFHACIAWVQSVRRPGEDKLGDTVDALAAALDLTRDPAPIALLDRLAGVQVMLNVGRKAAWGDDLTEVKRRLDEMREEVKRLAAMPRWNDHDATSLAVLGGLRALFDDACARYEARKRALGGLDYLDLELQAARLLESNADVARRCRETFRHLMVDEFQDTSPLQMRVLDLLAGRHPLYTADPGPRPERFFVGDAKQAIYRFRGSDVRQFNRVDAAIEATGGAVLRLSQSFRTHDPLVEVLNDLFAAILGDGTHEYEAPMQRMTGRGADAPLPPHLVLLPVSRQFPDGSRTTEEERCRIEADLVAAEVARLLGAAQPVWDNRERCYRPPRYSDVAVLLRRLTHVHLFERALEAHGVPYRTPAGAGFFTRQEVLDLTNLLAWLAEPDDAISLVGVLRSPLFLIDDLALLHLAQPARDRGWLATLADPPPGLSEAAYARSARAAAVLQDLRALAARAAVDEVIEAALQHTAYEAVWAPLPGGDQALANIRKFVAMARTLAGRSVDEFVLYVRRRRDELTAREGQAILDDTHAVRILTIHGAKGLDWPIVFVPEAHVDARDSYPCVNFRAEDGVAFTLALDPDAEATETRRPRSGFYSHLLARDSEEERAEHRRLLYVAATRAADRLVISGAEGGGWLAAANDVINARPVARLAGIERRDPAPIDLDAIARRPMAGAVAVPAAAVEVEFDPPLVARPAVIPLRASTPVTALRPRAEQPSAYAHGDGLALIRGVLAHRAVEVWFTTGARPDLAALLVETDDGALDAATRAHVAAEVDAMLDRFDGSDLAATLRDPATTAWFEFPFTWDWDGVPCTGTLDLLYRRGDDWHIVDFKTDDLRSRTAAEVATGYLSQLGLYAGALQRATGRTPSTALCFLRTGEVYVPPRDALEVALVAARAAIDQGALRAVDPDGPGDVADE